MTVTLVDLIDANNGSATSAALTLTDETVVTLYVFHESGNSDNYRVVLQSSPLGVGGKWRQVGSVISGVGASTTVVSAVRVRAKILKAEGAAASAEIQIVAK